MSADKSFKILKSLPAYGPMYISVSESGEPFYHEGLPVEFYRKDGTLWVANFETGWTNFVEAFEYPDKNIVIIFAKGIAYVMNSEIEKPIQIFGITIKDVFRTSKGDLICVDDTGIYFFCANKLEVWTSERISWDGFRNLTFDSDILRGQSYDPLHEMDSITHTEPWIDFSFNVKTKEVKGGSFRLMLEQNPHLEMKNRIEVQDKNTKKFKWQFWKK